MASGSAPPEKTAQAGRDSLCAPHDCLIVSQSPLMPLLALGEAAGLVECISGSAAGLPPRLLRLYPESLRGFPLPPFPHRQGILQLLAAVTGTSNAGVYAKPHLHKLLLPQEMNVSNKQRFHMLEAQHSSTGDPQTET